MRRDTFPAPLGGLAAEASGFQPGSTGSNETDGRRRRRLHNREAVVDALLDLYREGNLRPSTDEIAERAGLSPRSLFRYFEDVDDLAGAAVNRAQLRALPVISFDVDPTAPRAARVKGLVEQRFRVFDEVGHAATVVRIRAPVQPVVAELLSQNRAFLREQLRELFAAELGRLRGSQAREVLAALDVVSSYESYDLLQHDHRLAPNRARAAMTLAIEGILDAAVPETDEA
jgi:AcrR family transcriptional regulator